MRPRHQTAENPPISVYKDVKPQPASMRPRHQTAENNAQLERLAAKVEASMRPRHQTAENIALRAVLAALRRASMRPRHQTAENPSPAAPWSTRSKSFNEAAASNRGKLRGVPADVHLRPHASMRPRHQTAENGAGSEDRLAPSEASMRLRHQTAENHREPAGTDRVMMLLQ